MKAGIFLVLLAVMAVALPAQTFQTLRSFDSTNGAFPWAPLVQGNDGNFYGTTQNGGNPVCVFNLGYYTGCGTVFQVTPSGRLTTIFSFDGTMARNPSQGWSKPPTATFTG